MGKLYFMIGLPRSGKSTIAKQWLNHQITFDVSDDDGNVRILTDETYKRSEMRFGRVVVSADAWRLALGHRYNTYVEPLVHGQVKIAVRALLLNHDVLVDETNTNSQSIIGWLEEDINAIPVFINTPPLECK